mmetsp:Transcript_41911/g.89974  ORF Transcript_41911/g.89974 Transcript_41911/m.89974 type:complete len:467 (-) Transcript_41911:50-1450(-)
MRRGTSSSSSSASAPWFSACFGLSILILLDALSVLDAASLAVSEGEDAHRREHDGMMRRELLGRHGALHRKEGPQNDLNSASNSVPDTRDITGTTQAPDIPENGLDPTEDKDADPFDDDNDVNTSSRAGSEELANQASTQKADAELPDGQSNETEANRTVKQIMDEVNQMDANHKEDITSFMKNVRDDLDIYCTHGKCQATLDKLERGVKRMENRHKKYIKSMVPTIPPPIVPELMRNSPDWSGNFSTYASGSSPLSRLPINSVKCMEKYCATLQVKYLEQDLDVWDRGNWTDVVGDAGAPEVHCGSGRVVSQIRCTGMYCGSLQLLCQKPNTTVWQVDDTATEAKGWFNELEPGVSKCSNGYALSGLACHGDFCHSKRLLCKGTKPPARDCLFGPWSDWSDCGGECDNSLQMRNRSVYYDERWGNRCWGPWEHKRTCTQRRCVEESDSLSEESGTTPGETAEAAH